ncbi:MAG: hypothetical protein IJR54_00700 [Oscillibacter sp.]|nr:hypothetical protein [Oscillibacter sp.]
MKSRTSFFNPTLYRKNLTRFWTLWGLTAFFGALVPISGITMRLNGLLDMNAAEFALLYYDGVCYFAPAATLCYAILCAQAVWSYLYNARSVGMMHTLPISREGLFVTNFLSGLTMVAIPWAVVGVLCVILSLMCGAFSWGPLFLTVLCVLAEGVLYFSTATAAAFVTGNVFALPAFYFLFHFLAPMLDALITTFSSNMIFGLSTRVYTGVVDWLSPTVYIMKNVSPNSVYVERPIPGHPDITESVLQSVTLEKAWLIGVYMLVGLALLGVAYALYRYRKSECAGEVIAMRWGRPVFRYGISALFALGGGQLLYILLFNSFDIDESPYQVLPLIFCMFLSGAIGYYATSMLLAKTSRVFKGSLRGLSIVAAGCVAVCCVVGFDLLGVARRVPSADSLKYIRLYTANNTYYLLPGDDDAVIEELRDVHKAIIADRDYIQNELKNDSQKGEIDFTKNAYVTFRVCYYLKNGLSVYRDYFLWLDKDRMAEPGTYDNALDRFINSTEMKLRRLRFNDPRFKVEHGNISLQLRDDGFELSSRELEEILYAISEDTKAGAWGQYDWFENDASTYAVYLNFWYGVQDSMIPRSIDNIAVYLRPGMTSTINCLKKLGYLKDSDLITRAEMQKIWEERDKMLNPSDFSEEIDPSEITLEDIVYPSDEVSTETAAVFPQTAPVTEPVTNPNAPDSQDSSPQTPAESSAASSAN